jgi:hypothetical protein
MISRNARVDEELVEHVAREYHNALPTAPDWDDMSEEFHQYSKTMVRDVLAYAADFIAADALIDAADDFKVSQMLKKPASYFKTYLLDRALELQRP